MMDALIAHFVEQMKRRRNGENGQAPENVAEGMLKCQIYFFLDYFNLKTSKTFLFLINNAFLNLYYSFEK